MLSALPPACKTFFFYSDTVWMTHAKTDQNKFTFLQISHLSSNRRVHNLTLYFQFTTPARELTHRMKFEYQERHEFWKCHVSSPPWARETPKNPIQKDTNFGNAMFLRHLGPEKCQKSYPEEHEFQQRHDSSLF